MSSASRSPLPLNPFGPSANMKKTSFPGVERDEQQQRGAGQHGYNDMGETTGDGPVAPERETIRRPPPRGWKLMRFTGKLMVWASYTFLIYVFMLALNYYGIWDPCSVKFSYRRKCNVDFYGLEDVLSYTEYEEDFFCLVPGIGYHQEEKGWNLDMKCK